MTSSVEPTLLSRTRNAHQQEFLSFFIFQIPRTVKRKDGYVTLWRRQLHQTIAQIHENKLERKTTV